MTGTTTQPSIDTARLRLRPFELTDAAEVQRLAGEREIADTTSNIPHPYEDGMAEEWIAAHTPEFKERKAVTFAVIGADSEKLVGAIGLTFDPEVQEAELGYWVGKPFWNEGYATEAAEAVLAFGFQVLELERVYARHMARNPASGRVMQKAGMIRDASAGPPVLKDDQYENMVAYAMLRKDWVTGHPNSTGRP